MTEKVKEYIASLRGKKIAFVGMGVANAPSALFLARHGLQVYACDSRDESYIGKKTCEELRACGVQFSLGKDYLRILPEMDIVFRSNGILPFQNPWIGECIERGQTVTSEMEEFFHYCPAKIIGITGSNGKTTTTTLIYEMLKKAGHSVVIGGNIGKAMLPYLEDLTPSDYAVCELSSFQLLTMGNLVHQPDIAVVTNIESTHLDHHISLDEYVDAKRNVLIYQDPSQRTVLNADCDYSIGRRVYHDMRYDVRGKLAEFSLEKPVNTGAYLDDNDNIVYAEDGTVTQIMPASDIRLPGRHNIANYCTAIAAVWGLVQPEQIREVARTFGGVEHRIEFVREVDGVNYYNDSIATSPSRVISGVRAFHQKIIAIQGGSDKGNDLSEMVPDLLTHVKILILNGATADKIEQAVLAAPDYDPDQLQIIKVKDLAQAVEAARKAAQPGDIVSLCPACPAFDQFKTFEYRGREFKRLVNAF
mgnify:FL=1